MTLDELRKYPRPYLTPEQVARTLGADAHAIRLQARTKPELLGFPVMVCGTRTKIPTQPFIEWLFGKAAT